MVRDEVWERAWADRDRLPHGKEFLCVGCLETRLGRMLTHADFTDAPVNTYSKRGASARLRDRLCPDT
jgi:hypothetical protein